MVQTYAQPILRPAEKDTRRKEVPVRTATGIPAAMQEQFERLSGLSFADVRVHYNSDQPAQLQALAYTQGCHVYIAPGQERHLGHELGHIVQQKQGRVAATGYIGQIPLNNDAGLEAEADRYSRMAAQLKPMPGKGVVQREHRAFLPSTYQNVTAPSLGFNAALMYFIERLLVCCGHQNQIRHSLVLRASLVDDSGVPDPRGIENQAHHIVETGNSFGQSILTMAGIDSDSAINGVLLPVAVSDETGDITVHKGSHTRYYSDSVNKALDYAVQNTPQGQSIQAAVISKLQAIRHVLLTENVPINSVVDPNYNPRTGRGETVDDIFRRRGLY